MIDTLDAAGVTAIALKRKATAKFGVAGAVIGLGSSRVSVVAVASGRWDAAEILAACNRVRGTQFFSVPECATITNPGGIDEHRIARLCAADPNQSAVELKGLRTLEDLGFVTMSSDSGRHVAAWTPLAYLQKLRVA